MSACIAGPVILLALGVLNSGQPIWWRRGSLPKNKKTAGLLSTGFVRAINCCERI